MKQSFNVPYTTNVQLIQYDLYDGAYQNCFILKNTQYNNRDFLFHNHRIFHIIDNIAVAVCEDIVEGMLDAYNQPDIIPKLIVDKKRLYRIPNANRYYYKAILCYEKYYDSHEYVLLAEHDGKTFAVKIEGGLIASGCHVATFHIYKLWSL